MRHIPYGYKIENGMAVIDEEEAAMVRKFFDYYISGLALMAAAKKMGLKLITAAPDGYCGMKNTSGMIIIRQSLTERLSIRRRRCGWAVQRRLDA